MNDALIVKGLGLIHRAVDSDQRGDRHDALKYYELGLEALVAVIKDHKNQVVRSTLTQKVTEYMARAETLKTEIASSEALPSPTSVAAFPDPPQEIALPKQASEPPLLAGTAHVRRSKSPSRASAPLSPASHFSPPASSSSSPSSSASSATSHVKTIEIEEGQTGVEFDELFGPLFDGRPTSIVVEDPYLEANHQVYNLVYLLEVIAGRLLASPSSSVPCEVVVRSKSKACADERLLSLQRSIPTALSGLTLRLEHDDDLHDRAIRVSGPAGKFLISLGRGLDLFLPPQFGHFSLGHHQQKYRPCAKTRITIIKQ